MFLILESPTRFNSTQLRRSTSSLEAISCRFSAAVSSGLCPRSLQKLDFAVELICSCPCILCRLLFPVLPLPRKHLNHLLPAFQYSPALVTGLLFTLKTLCLALQPAAQKDSTSGTHNAYGGTRLAPRFHPPPAVPVSGTKF